MNLNIAIIGYVWPEPKSSAAGQNMLSIIMSCVKAGYNVTFLTAASQSSHKTDLSSFGVSSHEIALNCSSFDTLISKLQPDVVVFDRYMTEEQFSWRVKENCPNAIRVLNTEDLHSLRQARHDAVKKTGNGRNAILNNELAQREIAAILRSDITLVISQYELSLLKDVYHVPDAQLFYSPLVMGEPVQRLQRFEERAHFVHIGNFRHAPNWDAVLQLKQHIWPALKRALPQAELHIYGAYPPKKATQLHNEKQGFLVKGWAENVDDVLLNSRLLIAPLRFGAGIKGKLLDAMRCSTPSITTWVGTEGIVDDTETSPSSWPGAVCSCDTATPNVIQQYVTQAISLYTQEKEWSKASRQSLSCLQQFVKKQPSEKLVSRIESLVEHREPHREALFIQGLLWHQTLSATKYMSQWIEAKNKH